ncbi:glycine-rich protein [Hymenobacter sp. CA1UV-4]|nr:glycine-rich protein [Hymenobacter sp. CA1UV-4]MDO7854743.1 glycine-rich protein [Hymenobacter sp. CA1UV-4]
MKKRFPLLAAVLLALPFSSWAQTGGVRIGTAGTPHASAALEVNSTDKGLLPPRLTTAQRDAIASPAAGLSVFNITTNQLNVWTGTRWQGFVPEFVPTTLAYTGGPQTYTVPAGVTGLTLDMAGASGGGAGGRGGRVQATLAVTPGQVLTFYIGGAGAASSASNAAGGYNGGGSSGLASGGGGATDVRVGGTGLADRVLVAGGGGGGSSYSGGCGGGLVACDGGGSTFTVGGTGGSQSSGGSGASLGLGASGTYSGGGGGGYYGGGISTFLGTGGGGGSSYAGAGTSAVVHTQGYQTGNGYVRFTFSNPPAPVLDASNFINLDNLGNHTATQDLDLGSHALVGDGANVGSSVGLGVRADGGLNLGQNNGRNVFLGYGSGAATTSGIQNYFGGYNSGVANTSGNANVLVGYEAGYSNTTGTSNVALGYSSGLRMTTSRGNTFVGTSSGASTTTGSLNTAVGFSAGPTSGDLTNTTALGNRAAVSVSNALVLGGTDSYAVNVGIGTTAPESRLEVAGTDATATVATLVLNNTGATGQRTLNLPTDLTIGTALQLQSGLVRTAPTATITLPDGATLSGEASGQYVQGNLRAVRNAVSGTAAVAFPNSATLNPNGLSLGTVTVTRTAGLQTAGLSYGQNLAGTNKGIDRVWTVAATGTQPVTGTAVNVTFSWLADDDNGFALGTNAQLWRAASAAGPWAREGVPASAASRSFAADVTQFGALTLSNINAPLPVELTRFTAEPQGDDALLQWATASEKNNDHFEVEASADGHAFRRIGTVAGHGTSTQPQQYQLVDKAIARYAADPVYYRLRQVDVDGTVSYSPVRQVRVAAPCARCAWPRRWLLRPRPGPSPSAQPAPRSSCARPRPAPPRWCCTTPRAACSSRAPSTWPLAPPTCRWPNWARWPSACTCCA